MNGSTNIDQNTIERIQKLLALANHKNTNENEAALAMQRVQEILSAYNLSMAEVESVAAKKEGHQKSDASRKKDVVDKSAMYTYQRDLMSAIAHAHYCLYFVGHKGDYNKKGRYVQRKYHILVGREANVITAKLMFDYLNSTIDDLVNQEYPPPTNLCKSAVSWREGCARRLVERLHEKREEADRIQAEEATAHAQQARQPGTAIVLLSDVRANEGDFNLDFYYGYEPGTIARQRAEREAQWAKDREERANQPAIPSEPVKQLTDKQKAAQAERDRKAWEKYQKRQERQERKAFLSKDWDAYHAGKDKGDSIGLDTQVSKAKDRKAIQ